MAFKANGIAAARPPPEPPPSAAFLSNNEAPQVAVATTGLKAMISTPIPHCRLHRTRLRTHTFPPPAPPSTDTYQMVQIPRVNKCQMLVRKGRYFRTLFSLQKQTHQHLTKRYNLLLLTMLLSTYTPPWSLVQDHSEAKQMPVPPVIWFMTPRTPRRSELQLDSSHKIDSSHKHLLALLSMRDMW